LLKEKKIDLELLTAGNYKRTLTVFGHNTEEGREKMQEEINEVHELFKHVIAENRQEVDIEKVSTGEYWLGSQALALNLVDEISTSDDYLQAKSESANLYEVTYQAKKSFVTRLTTAANILKQNLFGSVLHG
jgi:serine protease SohB